MRKLFYLLSFFFSNLTFGSYVQAQTQDDYNLIIEDNVDYKFRDYVYEGCTDMYITITRPSGLTVPLDIPFTLSGNAKLGVDYILTYKDTILVTASSEFIKMDSDQSSILLQINTIHDADIELGEQIILNFEEFSVPQSTQTVSPSKTEFTYDLKDQPKLSLTSTADFTIQCPGDPAVIETELSGGVGGLIRDQLNNSYVWSQIGENRTQTVYPMDTTEYVVRANDICGTQFVFDTVTINVRPFKDYEDITAILDSIYVCDEVEVGNFCVSNLSGGLGSSYTYAWSQMNSESIISNDSCLMATPGAYEVSVSDACGFTPIQKSNYIYKDEAPDPFFEYLNVPDSSIMLEFNNYTPHLDGVTHEWFFQNVKDTSDTTKYIPNQHPIIFSGERYTNVLVGDSINPVTIQTPGTYEVSLKVTTATAGCSKKHSEYITLEPSYFFYAPNAFTPNGDALNDTFRPVVTGTKSYEFFVYDGFGKVVYSSSDRREEWDGTYKGKPAAEGIYIYKVIMTKKSDVVVFSEQGTVTLIR
jgi:gliding motility-associated-like protein